MSVWSGFNLKAHGLACSGLVNFGAEQQLQE